MIKVIGRYNKREADIAAAVEDVVWPRRYEDGGAVEDTRDLVNNTAELVGRLVKELVLAGKLNGQELQVVLGYKYEVIE